jgi:hypothetical protein
VYRKCRSRPGGLASTGKAVDLKSTGAQAPWGFESLALRHEIKEFHATWFASYVISKDTTVQPGCHAFLDWVIDEKFATSMAKDYGYRMTTTAHMKNLTPPRSRTCSSMTSASCSFRSCPRT